MTGLQKLRHSQHNCDCGSWMHSPCMLLGCNTGEHENAAANDAADAQHCGDMQHSVSRTPKTTLLHAQPLDPTMLGTSILYASPNGAGEVAVYNERHCSSTPIGDHGSKPTGAFTAHGIASLHQIDAA